MPDERPGDRSQPATDQSASPATVGISAGAGSTAGTSAQADLSARAVDSAEADISPTTDASAKSDTSSTAGGDRKGLILIFTGAGKGKTTAALGTGFRAAGSGLRVLMLQFIKGSWHYGELDAAAQLGDIFQIRPMGRGFIKVGGAETDPEDLRLIQECWAEATRAIGSGDWDMIILDEINYAIGYGLLDPNEVAKTLSERPPMLHVLLTGRNAHPALVAIADTVTEMHERKHAYQKGIQAQLGIEY